ncbi:Na/H antiporter [Penicillium citrinum]|uniref:Na/H antiporter n=1 Tax=Penicillium citrinum TaxID=5077 RepID=A0A9W9PC60_PENCI|nr:Na/H antiporter [Penicillium citrinum]KAJ5240568.1 Na/H antiporter [Penicillium citrinum]
MPLSISSFRSRKCGTRATTATTPQPPSFRIGRPVVPSAKEQPGSGQTDGPNRPVNLAVTESPMISNEDSGTVNSR